MSGRKRIYVDEGEWSRLQREAGKLSQLQRDLPRLISNVRDQTRADLDRTFQEFDARQRNVEQGMTGLSEQAAKFEKDTSRRLRENARRLRAQLADSEQVLRGETKQLRADFERSVAEERRERERGMDRLRAEITDVKGNQQHAAELEQTYLANARILHGKIAELPHELYQPGALDSLTRRLQDAESVREQGVVAYGLGNAQGLFHEMSELHLQVEQQDLQWRLAKGTAEQALRAIEELIRQNEVLTLDQPNLTTKPDVDFWSRGALSRLRNELTALQDRVRDEDQPLSLEELYAILAKQPELEQRLDAIVHHAGTAVFASQLRTNFAEVIAIALEDNHHYQVGESCFAGDDQREAFYAKGRHRDGSEVVIEVKPKSDDKPDCEVRILSYDEDTPAQEDRDARAQSIAESLKDVGISSAGFGEEPGEPDATVRDLSRVRQQQRATQ